MYKRVQIAQREDKIKNPSAIKIAKNNLLEQP